MDNRNINHTISTAVVILAAGKSNRMGTLKPFLKYRKHLLFIDKIISEYIDFGCEKIIVTFSENDFWFSVRKKYQSIRNVNFIENNHLEYERFYSVKLGLSNIGKVDFCFIQNSDNPFVNQEILTELYNNRKEDGYLCPTYKGKGGHPILIGMKVISEIGKENDNSNLKDVLKKFERIECNIENEKILVNINTKRDYLKYFKINLIQ